MSSNRDAENLFTASCQCGSVRCTGTELPKTLTKCHCRTCCKISGIPCTWASAKISALKFTAQDTLVEYHSSDIAKRGHCSKCGSVIFMQYHFQLPNDTDFPVGIIDEDSVKGTLPSLTSHIYCAEDSKPRWDRIPEDGLKRWDTMPPEFLKGLDRWRSEQSSRSCH